MIINEQEKQAAETKRLLDKANRLGIPGNTRLAKVLEDLEERIRKLEIAAQAEG